MTGVNKCRYKQILARYKNPRWTGYSVKSTNRSNQIKSQRSATNCLDRNKADQIAARLACGCPECSKEST